VNLREKISKSDVIWIKKKMIRNEEKWDNFF